MSTFVWMILLAWLNQMGPITSWKPSWLDVERPPDRSKAILSTVIRYGMEEWRNDWVDLEDERVSECASKHAAWTSCYCVVHRSQRSLTDQATRSVVFSKVRSKSLSVAISITKRLSMQWACALTTGNSTSKSKDEVSWSWSWTFTKANVMVLFTRGTTSPCPYCSGNACISRWGWLHL